MKVLSFALALSAALLGAAAHAQSTDKKVLTLEGARLVIDAASEQARRLKSPGGAITVVDDGGHVIAMERWDNTFPAAAQVCSFRQGAHRGAVPQADQGVRGRHQRRTLRNDGVARYCADPAAGRRAHHRQRTHARCSRREWCGHGPG